MANASEAKVARVCRRLLRKLWRLQVSGILQPHGSFRSVTRRYAVAFDWSPMGSAEMYLEFLCTFSTVLFRLYLEIVCVAGLTRCTGVSSGGQYLYIEQSVHDPAIAVSTERNYNTVNVSDNSRSQATYSGSSLLRKARSDPARGNEETRGGLPPAYTMDQPTKAPLIPESLEDLFPHGPLGMQAMRAGVTSFFVKVTCMVC
jgi:hypothetical protein